MYKIIKRLYFILKKIFGSKLFKFALKTGTEIWLQINTENGVLSKLKHLTKDGEWKRGGQAAYEKEKEARQKKWMELTRAAIETTFPQARSITSLLFLVHGMIGSEIKEKQKRKEAKEAAIKAQEEREAEAARLAEEEAKKANEPEGDADNEKVDENEAGEKKTAEPEPVTA